MTIKELSNHTGLTVQAIYKQIRLKKGYGRYFQRDIAGKWSFPAVLIADLVKTNSRKVKK